LAQVRHRRQIEIVEPKGIAGATVCFCYTIPVYILARFLGKTMHQDIERFLNLKHPPGRLTREETAWFLGFSPDEITILVSRGLLKPLGHPAANGQKFFLTAALEELKRDEKWFGKATDAIVEFWRNKNERKSIGNRAQVVAA